MTFIFYIYILDVCIFLGIPLLCIFFNSNYHSLQFTASSVYHQLSIDLWATATLAVAALFLLPLLDAMNDRSEARRHTRRSLLGALNLWFTCTGMVSIFLWQVVPSNYGYYYTHTYGTAFSRNYHLRATHIFRDAYNIRWVRGEFVNNPLDAPLVVSLGQARENPHPQTGDLYTLSGFESNYGVVVQRVTHITPPVPAEAPVKILP